MQLKGLIAWLFSEDKKPYYEDSNGLIAEGDKDTLLKPDGQPAHLKYTPDGWKDTLVNFGRSITYMGLFREFTVPMRFVKDGAKILRYILWTKGKNAIAYFALHRLNRLAYPHSYDTFTYGELDFVKSKQKQDDKTFTINVMQGGLSKLLKAGENTVYDIAVNTDANKKTVYLDGLPFTNKIIYTVYSGQEIVGTSTPQFYYLGMGIVDKTGLSQGVIMQDSVFQNTAVIPNNFYFAWSVSKTIKAKITGKISGICTYDNFGNDSNLLINIIRTSDSTNTIYQTVTIPTGGPFSDGDPFNVSFYREIDMNPHDRLYFRVAGTPWTQHLFTIQSGEITVQYDVKFDPTLTEGLSPYTLFERITDKMTEGKYGVKSTFLQQMDDLILTSGTALRRTVPSSIKTSLTDFFQAMKTRGKKKYSIGLGIEGDKLVIEELDYFFQDTVIMDLGVVDDLEIFIAEDLLYNTIKVGYKDQTVDDINGRNEVNVQQRYTTPNDRTPKELDLVSPYRSDPYGIESARSDQFGQKQTSSTADNETFLLSVEKLSTVDVRYYFGDFQTEINGGQYYIKIPSVLYQITNGEQLIISGSVSNNGTFTVENTSYLITGFTYIRVTQAVTNEVISSGTVTHKNTEAYSLLRPAYTSITGVDHPAEIFNVELSPKRCLLNCGGLIHSVHDKDEIKFIKFDSAVRNIELSTTIGGVTVTEKDSVVIGSLQDKLFLEYYMTFTTRVPIDYTTLMEINPYGKVKFTDSRTGMVLYGFLWDGGINPEPKDKKSWKLIAAPNQDLSKFI